MRKIIISGLIASLWILSGCNKFLDTIPDNRTEIDNVEKVAALLTSAYPNRTYMSILHHRVDGIQDYGTTLDGGQPSASLQYTTGAFLWEYNSPVESGNDTHENFWMSTYRSVAAANHALDAIERLGSPSEAEPYRGEAHLIRAYAHLMALSIFANLFDYGREESNPGIPYVEDVEETVVKIYDRKTVAYAVQKIKEDLETGLKLVGSSAVYNQPAFHFTTNSAYALAARFALWTRDYNSVITYVSNVIPNVTLLNEMNSGGLPFYNQDGTRVKFVNTGDAAYLFAGTNFHDWPYYSNTVSSGGTSAIGQAFTDPDHPSNLLTAEVASLHTRAIRGSASTRHGMNPAGMGRVTSGYATGGTFRYPAYRATGDETTFIPKFYEDFQITGTTATGASTGYAFMKTPLFRLEEMLLNRAEAYAMTGQYDEAINDLNIYIQRRVNNYANNTHSLYRDRIVNYYADVWDNEDHYILNSYNTSRFSEPVTTYEGKLQRALIMTILDFRNSEFYAEGLRYHDILRWFIPVTHYTVDGRASTLTPDDDRRLLQIPESAKISEVQPNETANTPSPWSFEKVN